MAEVCLKVSEEKTYMRMEKMNDDEYLTMDQRVEEFKSFGAIITENNNTSKEIHARIHIGNSVIAAPKSLIDKKYNI